MRVNTKKRKDIELIITVIKEAGYNPYEQLYAYFKTTNEMYITRKGNAREKIKQVGFEQIEIYLQRYRKL